jgi:hypothetical protein
VQRKQHLRPGEKNGSELENHDVLKIGKIIFLHIFTICEWAIYYTKLLDNSRGHQQKQQHVPWRKK